MNTPKTPLEELWEEIDCLLKQIRETSDLRDKQILERKLDRLAQTYAQTNPFTKKRIKK
jgi:hypothetical protein